MASVSIRVNGQSLSLPAPATLEQVIAHLGLVGRKGIALAVREQVIPRSQWATRAIQTGDDVIVIQATQGG